MRNLFLSVALIAGLSLPMGPAHAQSTATVTHEVQAFPWSGLAPCSRASASAK
jgi:hypothetical protein